MKYMIHASGYILLGGAASYTITRAITEIYEKYYPHYILKNKHNFINISILCGMSLGLLRYRLGQAILPYYLQ